MGFRSLNGFDFRVNATYASLNEVSVEMDRLRRRCAGRLEPLLNRGIVPSPPVTNIELFKQSAEEFLVGVAAAEHIGSMFTVRTVLPYREATDERPTVVERVADDAVVLFSAKIGTCVEAARHVVRLLHDEGLAEQPKPSARPSWQH